MIFFGENPVEYIVTTRIWNGTVGIQGIQCIDHGLNQAFCVHSTATWDNILSSKEEVVKERCLKVDVIHKHNKHSNPRHETIIAKLTKI